MNQIEQDQIGQLRQAATEYLQRGWDSLPTMGKCTFFGGETTKSRKASEQINACFPYRPYNESYSGLSQRCGALVVVDEVDKLTVVEASGLVVEAQRHDLQLHRLLRSPKTGTRASRAMWFSA